jgi:hypothetical protein
MAGRITDKTLSDTDAQIKGPQWSSGRMRHLIKPKHCCSAARHEAPVKKRKISSDRRHFAQSCTCGSHVRRLSKSILKIQVSANGRGLLPTKRPGCGNVPLCLHNWTDVTLRPKI